MAVCPARKNHVVHYRHEEVPFDRPACRIQPVRAHRGNYVGQQRDACAERCRDLSPFDRARYQLSIDLGVRLRDPSSRDARLPPTSVSTSDSEALRSLVESGAGREELVSDAHFTDSTGRLVVRTGDARVIGRDGEPHPRRFAVGPYTSAPFVGAFARPATNAVSFRENNRVARAVLTLAATLSAEPAMR
jgi:hypothetical protein